MVRNKENVLTKQRNTQQLKHSHTHTHTRTCTHARARAHTHTHTQTDVLTDVSLSRGKMIPTQKKDRQLFSSSCFSSALVPVSHIIFSWWRHVCQNIVHARLCGCVCACVCTYDLDTWVLLPPPTPPVVMMMSWCLMSSDVIWHIRDKLWPMPKHGSVKSTYVRCMRV